MLEKYGAKPLDQDLLERLAELLSEYEWAIGIPNFIGDEEECTGLFIGTVEFLEELSEKLEDDSVHLH